MLRPLPQYAAIAFVFFASSVAVRADDPNKSLPRSSPEAQGVKSSAVFDFVDTADKQIQDMHSFILVRRGHVVAEGWWTPYDSAARHELYSLSKSFTSTAVGMAIAEGKLSLDDEVLKFFPEDGPKEPSSQLKSMRVRDLLCMSTGHTTEPKVGTEEPWTKTFLNHPVTYKPGTHFLYNTPSTYMLSAIVQKQTGEKVVDYLKPRLFEPLGIVDPTWGNSPQGVSLGGFGLSVRTEDIAKFGQLYLQKGQWNNQSLIKPEWIALATSKQTSNGSSPNSDWDQGYGFQFWRCRHGNYRGDGAFGQYCIVMPEHDAVVAITSGVKDMQAVMNLVWDKLLPAFHSGKLESNEVDYQKLKTKLASLKISIPKGSSKLDSIEKLASKTFAFEPNDQKLQSLRFESKSHGTDIVLETESGVQRIECRGDQWTTVTSTLPAFASSKVSTCGAWENNDTLVAKVCLFETPYIWTMKFNVKDDSVTLDMETNVGFRSTKQLLVGKVK